MHPLEKKNHSLNGLNSVQKDSIMQSLKAKLGIGTDRRLTIQLPENLPKGKYEVVLSFANSTETKDTSAPSGATGFVYATPADTQYDVAEITESNFSQ